MKALAKDPGYRYRRAGELQEDLQRLLRCVASERHSPDVKRTVQVGFPSSPGEILQQCRDALSATGRALVAQGRDLWERRHELGPRHMAVLSVAGGMVLLSLILLLLHWTDPLTRARRDLKAGRAEAAIAELLELKGRRPGSANVDYVLGEAYLQAGRNGPAVKAYRRAIELEPAYAKDTALLRRMVGLLGSGEVGGEVSKLMIAAGEPAAPVLDEVLDSRPHRLRWNAVRTLEQMGKRPDYVRPYLVDLQYEDCFARKQAAERLGELGDRRAIRALEEAKRRRLLDNYCMLGALDRALERLGVQ
jgi:tetratricopeptide (TPR) repeat protein